MRSYRQTLIRQNWVLLALIVVLLAFILSACEAQGAECEVVSPVIAINDMITARAKAIEDVALAEDGSRIDVMVLYTPQAREAAGSAANIESQIWWSIVAMNQGMLDSGVPTVVELVYSGEVPYVESGSSNTDLGQLRGGSIPGVYELRDKYAADLVSMVCSNLGGVCGTGYLMSSISPVYSNYGFSVVMRSCLTNKSLAHEMGHNMGLCHNRENNTGVPAVFCGYGAHTENYGAIMCYPPWARVNLWGGVNPQNLVNGQWPIGDANNDCAFALRQVLKTVANYRHRTAPPTTAPTPTPTPIPAPATKWIKTFAPYMRMLPGRIEYSLPGPKKVEVWAVNAASGVKKRLNLPAYVPNTGEFQWTVALNAGQYWFFVKGYDVPARVDDKAQIVTVQ